jgi:hypothetical protein
MTSCYNPRQSFRITLYVWQIKIHHDVVAHVDSSSECFVSEPGVTRYHYRLFDVYNDLSYLVTSIPA